MSHFVADGIASSYNSRMVQSDGIEGNSFVSCFNKSTLRDRRLRSNPKVMSQLLKRNAQNEAIAEVGADIPRFTRPKSVTLLLYYKPLFCYATSVRDVYDKYTLNDKFFEGVKDLIGHNIRGFCGTSLHAGRIELFFYTPSLLAAQGAVTKQNQIPVRFHKSGYLRWEKRMSTVITLILCLQEAARRSIASAFMHPL